MPNRRIYYAVKSIAFAECGTTSFTIAHGVQSATTTTRFPLEQFFEFGQIEIYELAEALPEIEFTAEKLLDGYPPMYTLATLNAPTPSLAGRSNKRTTVGISVFDDAQDSASGTAIAQCMLSGMYPSTISYAAQIEGGVTESLTFVGNNKEWTTFTVDAFDNEDEPLAVAGGSGGVQQRQDILFGPTDTTNISACLLPTLIPGITASGTNEQGVESFGASVQRITVSTNLGRDQLLELGRRGPYHRYAQFPVEVNTEIEVVSRQGDQVDALEANAENLTDQRIYLIFRDGTRIDLGTRNKLSNVTDGGATAGTQGANDTVTYSLVNYNFCTLTHPQDPTTALRP